MPLRHNPDMLSAPPGKRECMVSGAMEENGFVNIGAPPLNTYGHKHSPHAPLHPSGLTYTIGTLRIEYGRDCPLCQGPPETLEHLLVLCPAVRPFWTRVQDLLARRLAWRLPTPAALGGGDKESWLLHFGPIGSRSGATTNIDLVRLITAMARYRVFIVRNICLHDRRTGLHWPTFTGLLTAHLRHLHSALEQRFTSTLVPHNTLIQLTPSGLTLNL
uniref:Reverse transcriptase zinc-binding domain-containing protein n=1 Tax=Knipowitschia caucasica TaxID=637954 RepID=A0AAV2MG53_KNICA